MDTSRRDVSRGGHFSATCRRRSRRGNEKEKENRIGTETACRLSAPSLFVFRYSLFLAVVLVRQSLAMVAAARLSRPLERVRWGAKVTRDWDRNRRDVSACRRAVPVRQTIEGGATASRGQNIGTGHLREGQAWPEHDDAYRQRGDVVLPRRLRVCGTGAARRRAD